MKKKYEVEITKIIDGEKCEYLSGYVNDLDELVENIEVFIERMRPVGDVKKNYTLEQLKQKVINYLYCLESYEDTDAELLKILLLNE